MTRKRQRPPTFAELAARPTGSETDPPRHGAHVVRPGAFNLAGELFDPEGRRLRLRTSDVSPRVAQQAVDSGAQVAVECCGCGGTMAGCGPRWLGPDEGRSLRGGAPPELTGRHGAPTWLDVWEGDGTTVVFAHGDVEWSSTLR